MTTRQPKRLTPLDYLVLTSVLAAVLFILYRLVFELEYKWNWSIIPTYMFKVDATTGNWQLNMLTQGLLTTIKLSIWGTLLAAILGVWMGIMRTSTKLFYRLIGQSYVEVIRNLPPLVLVFIFYFFVSDQLLPLLGIEEFFRSQPESRQPLFTFFFAPPNLITPFISGVITIGIFQGAYITEIVRAGIQAIDKGQWEASSALGLTRWQQLQKVILPQATRIMLPPMANEFINTIKYSSIVSVISIQELTFQGLQVMASTQVSIEVWLTITLMYLVICLVLSVGVNWLEKKMAVTGRR